MRKQSKFKDGQSLTGFLDVLFCMLLLFVCLFTLEVILPKQEQANVVDATEESPVEPEEVVDKAEYDIVIENNERLLEKLSHTIPKGKYDAVMSELDDIKEKMSSQPTVPESLYAEAIAKTEKLKRKVTTLTNDVETLKKSSPNTNARDQSKIVIKVNWDDDGKDDIDLWIEGPPADDGHNKNIIFFGHKKCKYMYLDTDDIGNRNTLEVDEYTKETVRIVKLYPGKFIINLHAYSKRSKEPRKVSIIVEKLTPTFSIIYKTFIILTEDDEKSGVCTFIINEDLKIVQLKKSNEIMTRLQNYNRPCPMNRETLEDIIHESEERQQRNEDSLERSRQQTERNRLQLQNINPNLDDFLQRINQ